ncbi:hypothetical protein ACFYVL_07210 [Streptomyces sp. NPDC004111]|uniref:hypothetical protein n=1 Tax=Streptomyces sp. NPDC004111 TaxID=3364690 RepID=UPI0036C57B80
MSSYALDQLLQMTLYLVSFCGTRTASAPDHPPPYRMTRSAKSPADDSVRNVRQ